MKSFLIRLYPARWRARYGEEFAAILDARPFGPFDVADVLLGALDAQLHLRGQGAASSPGRMHTMSLRIGGYAAIVAATLWTVGAVLSLRPWAGLDAQVRNGLFVAGLAAVLVALAGLSAFQARTSPRLAWAAFALPAIGSISALAGAVGMALDLPGNDAGVYWTAYLLGLLAGAVGSGLFGLATVRSAVLSRAAALLLVLAVVLIGVSLLLRTVSFALGDIALYGGAIVFVAGWFGMGVQAILLDRPAPRPSAA